MDVGRYHKLLRVSAVIIVSVLMFDGGYFAPITKELSDNTINYLANSVGITASIEPNEFNLWTAELTSRERELDEREREIASREFGGTARNDTDYSTYILSTILFILMVLILLNYTLDWARVKRVRHEEQTA